MITTAHSRVLRILWNVGLALSLLGGLVVFAWQVDAHYAIRQWLFWSYFQYWILAIVFTVACWSAGDAIVRRIVLGLPATERIVAAFASGLLSFFLGMFLGGILGLFGSVFFACLPLIMIVAGGMPFVRFLRRGIHHFRGAWRRSPLTLLGSIATAFGLVGVVMVYFLVLTPDNVSHDARWFHLAIAEHYAAQGAIRPFPEGWVPGAMPQLASLVYTWAFLLPGGDLFDRVELSTHLEFVIFLWTLASIPVLVRSCARRGLSARHSPFRKARVSGAATWAAMFLFPGIFVYDSTLNGGADHVTAFWAIPVLLALLRFLRGPGIRSGALLAVPLSGALLTQYQGILVAAFPMVVVALFSIFRVIRSGSQRPGRADVLLGALTTAIAGLLLTSPHWLKNWIWYGDPIYPFLHAHLAVHPWTADAANLVSRVFDSRIQGSFSEKLVGTMKALVSFSFQLPDGESFHGKVPVFGSLFTLSIVPLLFLRRTLRTWLVVLGAHTGLFAWLWMFREERSLQALVPWMATVVATTCLLAWQSGVSNKAAVSIFVLAQVAWGGDVYFFPTHGVLNASPINAAIDLMSTGYRKRVKQRRDVFAPFSQVAQKLRSGSKVLVHDMPGHLGLAAMSVSDWGPWQGGISYGRSRSPRALYDQLRGYGVTHILWQNNEDRDSFAGDLAFYGFVTRYAQGAKSIGGVWLARMPSDPPPDTPWLDARAAVFVCSGYAPGQYRLGDLTVPAVGPKHYGLPLRRAVTSGEVGDVVGTSEFLVYEPSCHHEVPAPKAAGYRLVSTRAKTELWVRPAPL